MTVPASVRGIAEWVRDDPDRLSDLAGLVSAEITERDQGPEGLKAFLAHDPDAFSRAADGLREGVSEGGASLPLAGVPVAVKDNICTLDYPTTCGSRILAGFRPPYEATVVRRLRAAGALIAGKTNMDEFAMGSSTENSAYGPTRNPHDPGRVPGGSSGGSAAAVAAGLVPAALGSDTGGSVRQPASLCGVVGLKATYGAVSRYGLVAFASSLDHVGTFGRTVEDATRVLEVIAGGDPMDATCRGRPSTPLLPELPLGIEGMVVGVPREYFPEEMDAGTRRVAESAIEMLAAAGADIRPISLPESGRAIAAYYVIAPAEASSNLARFDGVRYGLRVEGDSPDDVYRATRSRGFGAEVKRRIMLGTFALSAGHQERYYGRAQRVRARIARDFDRAFGGGVDVIFTPTTPGPAFRFGEYVEDPAGMYGMDVFTVAANLAGLPGISVPIGRVDGLPVGGQILGPLWGEAPMLRAAAALERAVAARGAEQGP